MPSTRRESIVRMPSCSFSSFSMVSTTITVYPWLRASRMMALAMSAK